MLPVWSRPNSYPFPGFYLSVVRLLKTLSEMEKLLVTSNFPLSHSVSYPLEELSAFFIKFKNCRLQTFNLDQSEKFTFGKDFKKKHTKLKQHSRYIDTLLAIHRKEFLK